MHGEPGCSNHLGCCLLKTGSEPALHICTDCRGYFDSPGCLGTDDLLFIPVTHTHSLIEEEAILKEWSISVD